MISTDNLRIIYPSPTGPVEALAGVDLRIDAGERIAIIGRSGSGKTSLLRALAGLVPPASGGVEVAGHTMGAQRPNRSFYEDVGVVFQDYGLVPQLTPLDNATCGALHSYDAHRALARPSAQDRAQALRYLELLGVRQRAHIRAKRLSGGEQQRVAIARLLMQDPRVLLLDEPIASLDVHWGRRALDLLAEVRGGDATALVTLHDLEMARTWATRVLLIQDGALIFDGDPERGCAMLEDQGILPDVPALPSSLPTQDAHAQDDAGEAVTLDEDPGLGRAPFYLMIVAALIAIYGWAVMGLEIPASKIFGSGEKALDFLGRMLPPDPSVAGTIYTSIIETIQMALIGTTLAAIMGLPLAVAAARNVSPWFLRGPMRVVLNLMRTVPSIIWGLFFVAIVGLGPFPGILALSFYATGYLGKFYYEAIESIDPKPLVALRTTGASRLHLFRYGVFPQVLPLLASYTIYMFEYNVRSASILGVVGAGGVGFYLYSYLTSFTYQRATMALVMLLVVVTVIDFASSYVRGRLTE